MARFLRYLVQSRIDVVVGWYRKGEIERNDVILYFEEFVNREKDESIGGSREASVEMAKIILDALAVPFAALAQFLDTKWNAADSQTRQRIRGYLPKSIPLSAQKCDDNASLHAMVADAASHHVNDSSQWSEALAKLRAGKIISIAVGEALNTVLPRPKLGALAFFIKKASSRWTSFLSFATDDGTIVGSSIYLARCTD